MTFSVHSEAFVLKCASQKKVGGPAMLHKHGPVLASVLWQVEVDLVTHQCAPCSSWLSESLLEMQSQLPLGPYIIGSCIRELPCGVLM